MVNPLDIRPIANRIEGKKLVAVVVPPPDSEGIVQGTQLPLMLITTYCHHCDHYTGQGACKAYPDGIPLEIALAVKDHRQPVEGDQGVTYLGDDRPVDFAITHAGENEMEHNLVLIENGKCSIPVEFPSVFGQIVRGDKLDPVALDLELSKYDGAEYGDFINHLGGPQ